MNMYKTVTFVSMNILKTAKRRDCGLYHIHLNKKQNKKYRYRYPEAENDR